MIEKEKKADADFKWIDKISTFLDSKYTIPGTDFRFGLDPILGIIPGLGDVTAFTFSSFLILLMARKGASGKVVTLMVINVVIDTVIGSIPILGTIFDAYYKANNRNVRLLKRYYQEGKYQGSGKGVLAITLVVLIIISIALFYLLFKFIEYVFDFLGGLF
jgi:hypothetical protein